MKKCQSLYFCRSLKRSGYNCKYSNKHLRMYVESILTGCIVVRYDNFNAHECERLQKVVDPSLSITGTAFPSMESLCMMCGLKKAESVIKDPYRLGCALF